MRILLLFFAMTIATLTRAQHAVQKKAANSVRQEEIIYGHKDGMALTMIRLNPAGTSKGKAIVNVVSANYYSGYDMIDYTAAGSKVYTDNGYTVFMVMHSSQPKYSVVDEVKDLKRAVRYIRYHAARYKVDPGHIGITGRSSGGNLSLLIATADDDREDSTGDPVDRVSARVQAAGVFYPPTDLLNFGAPGYDIATDTSVLVPSRIWEAFDFSILDDSTWTYHRVSDSVEIVKIIRRLSPIYAATPDDPPMLLIHGDADRVVPLQQSKAMIARLNELHVPCRLIIKKGAGHGWDNEDPERKEAIAWFDKYL